MNTRKIARNTLRNRFQAKSKFSSTRFPKRLNYSRANRLNRRLFPKFRRNRLQRVQTILGYNRKYQRARPKRNYNYYSFKISPKTNVNSKKEVFVKGLPRFVDNKGLFNLFKNEGRINQCKILYDNIGFSRGIGKIEFSDFRDAWKTINKWNNSNYKGFTLKLEYKKTNNGQKSGNTGNNPKNDRNNKNYVNSSNYTQYNGYSKKYKGNNYKYNNYRYPKYNY